MGAAMPVRLLGRRKLRRPLGLLMRQKKMLLLQVESEFAIANVGDAAAIFPAGAIRCKTRKTTR
jgi:hypothetical protein